MDIEAVRHTLEQASLGSLAAGLAIGFFFSFNPVALAAIPVSLAYLTQAQARQRTLLLASMFVLGMIVTHALLGLVVGLGGGWIQRLIGREWGLMLGPIAIVMGLAWPGLDQAADPAHSAARAALRQHLGRGGARGVVLGGDLPGLHARARRAARHRGRRRLAALRRAAAAGVRRGPRRPGRRRCVGDGLARRARRPEALAASAGDRRRPGVDPFRALHAQRLLLLRSRAGGLGPLRSGADLGPIPFRLYAGACHPASTHSSPLTAEFASMKQIASAISAGAISRPSCVYGRMFLAT